MGYMRWQSAYVAGYGPVLYTWLCDTEADVAPASKEAGPGDTLYVADSRATYVINTQGEPKPM